MELGAGNMGMVPVGSAHRQLDFFLDFIILHSCYVLMSDSSEKRGHRSGPSSCVALHTPSGLGNIPGNSFTQT